MVDRRVTHRWIGTSVHHCGISSSRMRGYTTPPYMFLLPGYGPRSSNSVRNPPRAASIAAHEPAGPAPTMTTSKSVSATARICFPRQPLEQLVEHGVGVGDHGQICELHHGTVRIGVDADDVVGPTETAGVLHRAADAEGDVEPRVDDHTRCTDLALVCDPAAVGDDPGRADAGLQSRAKSCELIEALRRVEPGAAGNDAAGFGEVDRGGISLERLFDRCVLSRRHRQRHVANGDIAVDHVDATDPGLKSRHEGRSRRYRVQLRAAVADHVD